MTPNDSIAFLTTNTFVGAMRVMDRNITEFASIVKSVDPEPPDGARTLTVEDNEEDVLEI